MFDKFLLGIVLLFCIIGAVWFVYILYLMWRFVSETASATNVYEATKKISAEKIPVQYIEQKIEKAMYYHRQMRSIAYIVQGIVDEKRYLDSISEEMKELKNKLQNEGS